jgi:hypothetical protein
MPVEIRELIIRAVVKEEQNAIEAAETAYPPRDQQALVEECVKQVLKILKRKQEK